MWQRLPTEQELRGLIQDYVHEEIAYREALALGLDRDDTIIRRRLRQKLEFVSDDVAAQAEPPEAADLVHTQVSKGTYMEMKSKKILIRVSMRLAVLMTVLAASVNQAAAQGEVDAKTVAKANNPLADLNAFNFHNFYAASLHGVPNATSNTLNLRGVVVAGRQIVRATLPVATVPTGTASSVSGLGDFNIFDAIVLTGPDAATTIAIGPLLVAPTATDDALGARNTWQAGASGIAVKTMGGAMVVTILTWQTDFAGGDDRVDTNLMTSQVFFVMMVEKGWYLRSAPLWLFNFQDDFYVVPLGLGAGKVLRLGKAVANLFLEPQFTVYHRGQGAPSLQVFLGMNFQFMKKR